MSEERKQAIIAALKSLIGLVGIAITSLGFANNEIVQKVVGQVTTAIPLVWFIWDAFHAEVKTKEREVSAVNAALDFADRTTPEGVTVPPVDDDTAKKIIKEHGGK